MKQTLSAVRRVLSLACALAAFTSCGGGDAAAPSSVAVASITLSPTTLTLQVGEAFFIKATPLDASGHTVTGKVATWTSSAASVASIAESGIVTANAVGGATITVTIGGQSASVTMGVITAIHRVSVSPVTPTVEVGGNLTMSLVLLDASEQVVNAVVPTKFTSSDPDKASITDAGVVTPKATGSVVITGSFSTNGTVTQVATTTLTITPHVTTTSVDILPNPVGLIEGQTRALTAFARGANGAAIPGRTFTWTTGAPLFLAVSASGIITAVNPGGGSVSATSEGITGSTSVSVFSSAPAAGTGVGFGPEQFATIPAGSFSMGSTGTNVDETPVRVVTLTTAFKMQRTEVTRIQWQSIMGSLPAGQTGCDLCPVSNLTWDDAQAFIVKLNVANPGAAFRLPTEAQWEYAARANTITDYPGEPELIAQYFSNSDAKVWPVALRQPNAFGLYDVLGNVAEWTLDWYVGPAPGGTGGYAGLSTTDPTGAATGSKHVDRGGSYLSVPYTLRSAYRSGAAASLIGLRLVRN